MIARVKTQWIEKKIYIIEKILNINVKNELAPPIWTSET
jgi:hypothetical protein